MAKATAELIAALRRTAAKLDKGVGYQWGHMGSCNCGHLAQELSGLSKAEIHAYAMRKYGDWTEQVQDYCPSSKMPMDLLISTMLEAGLSTDDLKNLERLSDQSVLENLKGGKRYLNKNSRADVVEYLKTWASMLENEYLKSAPNVAFENTIALRDFVN
jgi:hypothetical protein